MGKQSMNFDSINDGNIILKLSIFPSSIESRIPLIENELVLLLVSVPNIKSSNPRFDIIIWVSFPSFNIFCL